MCYVYYHNEPYETAAQHFQTWGSINDKLSLHVKP